MLKRSAWLLACLPLSLSVACGEKTPDETASSTSDAGDESESGTGTDSAATAGDGDSTSTDTTATTTGDGDGDTGAVFVADTGDGDYECPNGDIPSMVPVTMMGNTMDGFLMMDEMHCDEAGGQEVVWTWTPPSAGFFRFDTIGSAGDTTLYIRDATCDGPVLACGGDIESGVTPQTEIARFLNDGQTVQVVVDHTQFLTDSAIVLNIDEITGPGAQCDLIPITGTLPITVSGDTSTEINKMTGSCFGEGPELFYTWTAPADGQYRFTTDTMSTTFDYDTVLYILDEHGCGGVELGCNDDVSLGMQRDSIVRVDLVANQDVTIVVDGWSNTSGPFDLIIEAV